MKISEKLDRVRPAFSFEFFPPKDEAGVERLFETVAALARYNPAYVSVTYGAGGSTRRLTVDLVKRIKGEAGIETMAHLTCVGARREEIAVVLDELREGGIDNVIALRGDPPKGQTTFVTHEGGFSHASELIGFIRARYDFCIAAACYPECHPESMDAASDLEFAKQKVELGAEVLVSQMFFDNEHYFSYVERARAAGIQAPIVAGLMPITNLSQIQRFAALCGSTLPKPLVERLEAAGNDLEAVQRIGVEHAIDQCRGLLERGVPGIHFYTLNRSPATVRILDALLAH
jgi:methylenetetrahydrofolate reductase (NADPH)